MNFKKRAVEYLSFTRRDRIAIITLVMASLLLYLVPFFLPDHIAHKPPVIDTSWIAAIQKLEQNDLGEDRFESDHSIASHYERSASPYPRPKGELFPFDPNTITVQEWKRLGLRDKTINTIQNYRNKGGKFRSKEDLKKIYGLFEDEYERLEAYVKIETRSVETGNRKSDPDSFRDENRSADLDSYRDEKFSSDNRQTFYSKTHYSIIEINEADTTALIALPGIGSKLALRIINFRDKLGGFYSVEQVGETFGLADSVFQKIKKYLKIDNTSIKKININSATLDELKTHPYIRYAIANPIIAYRNEHGGFKSIEDLKKVMAVTETVYKKIENYVMTE